MSRTPPTTARRPRTVTEPASGVDVQAILHAERQRTLAQIDALAADLADIIASAELVATDDEHDPEGATVAFERSRIDALLTQAREHLLDLGRAERRLVDGTYGRCERCGQQIGAERLDARTTASLCISCAAAADPSRAGRGRSGRAARATH
jgi:DnaK suppressor protein